MYRCKDCGKKFSLTRAVYEQHNLDNPPFEKREVCPKCGSENIREEKAKYCRCCGALLKDGREEYCDAKCRRQGQRLWENERRRYRRLNMSSISQTVAKIEEYNKANGTCLTYGQYLLLNS